MITAVLEDAVDQMAIVSATLGRFYRRVFAYFQWVFNMMKKHLLFRWQTAGSIAKSRWFLRQAKKNNTNDS